MKHPFSKKGLTRGLIMMIVAIAGLLLSPPTNAFVILHQGWDDILEIYNPTLPYRINTNLPGGNAAEIVARTQAAATSWHDETGAPVQFS